MDIATVLGIVGAFGVIMASIVLGGSASTFLNIPSLVVVIGGTAAVTLGQVSLQQFIGSIKVGLGAFMYKVSKPEDLITEAVELANVARKEGLLALEGKQIEDPFLDKGIRMCIDGHAADMIQKMLSKDINMTLERQATGIQMFKSVETAAPAMGMIGTLIGLVQMLANMDDPKSIGPAMAVALLTTLYGAVIANAIAVPIGEKLRMVSAQERLNKMLILESIAAIQDGTNPRILQQLLVTFLPEDKRDAVGK